MNIPSETEVAHAHHWEVSWAALVTVLGVFFLIPLAFSAFFVYENALLMVVFAGIGAPLLLAGIAKWVSEGMSQKNLVVGAAVTGLPIFIISEIFIFLSLFVSYWMMRLTIDAWPPQGTPEMPVVIPIIMTVVLVSSSFTMHHAEAKLEANDRPGFNKWLIISILLGALFLSFTFFEYSHLLGVGFDFSTNAYSTVFYSITGFHASHVLIGMLAFTAVLVPALKGRTNETFVKCVSVYWHFVDMVWLFVVSQIYFW